MPHLCFDSVCLFFQQLSTKWCTSPNGFWGDGAHAMCKVQPSKSQRNHLLDPPSSAPCISKTLPRLCVALCLQAGMGLVMILATVCSTWVAVNLGTSRRSCLVPQGSVTATANRRGNKMVCRTGSKIFWYHRGVCHKIKQCATVHSIGVF